MSVVGVPPLTERQVSHRHRAAIGALPDDARIALGWLRRGRLVSSPLLPLAVRRMLLRRGGIEIGDMVYGLTRCYFGSSDVRLGTGAFVNDGCWFEGRGRIEIGENCMLGPQVMILTSHHAMQDGVIERMPSHSDVTIGPGAWIGARATILPGVSIGAGAVVAAGAVVSRDCEDGAVIGGVPARSLR